MTRALSVLLAIAVVLAPHATAFGATSPNGRYAASSASTQATDREDTRARAAPALIAEGVRGASLSEAGVALDRPVWTQKDPLGFAAGDTSLYVYAFGDPVSFVDPSGEIAFLPALALAWAIAEAGASIADAIATLMDLLDPCLSTWDKALATSIFLAGVVLLGGGGSTANRVGRNADEVADLVKLTKTDRLKQHVLNVREDVPISREGHHPRHRSADVLRGGSSLRAGSVPRVRPHRSGAWTCVRPRRRGERLRPLRLVGVRDDDGHALFQWIAVEADGVSPRGLGRSVGGRQPMGHRKHL